MTLTKPQQLLLRDLFVGSVTGTYLKGAKSNIAFNLAKLGLVEVIRPFLVVGGHFVITTAGRAVVKPQEAVDPPLAERAPVVVCNGREHVNRDQYVAILLRQLTSDCDAVLVGLRNGGARNAVKAVRDRIVERLGGTAPGCGMEAQVRIG